MSGRRRHRQVRHEHRLQAALRARFAFAAAGLLAIIACDRKVTPPAPEIVELERHDGVVTVVSVGDILLAAEGLPLLRRHGYDWPFAETQRLLAGAHLIIGNLEGPITDAPAPLDPERPFNYKAQRAVAPALRRAGFRALSFANNHTMDYGVEGMSDTIAAVSAHGMQAFGAGTNEAAARRGVVYDLGSVRIGMLSYAASWRRMHSVGAYAEGDGSGAALVPGVLDTELADDIARVREHADVVIVSIHWGRNYRAVTARQRRVGRRAIDLGADIVNGHHPHILQGIEIYDGKPILYSLGNFAFTTLGRFPEPERGYGLVARMFFEDRKLVWLAATPIATNNVRVQYQSRPLSAREARAALWPHLWAFGTAVRWRGDTAVIGFREGWHAAALPALPWQLP